MTNIKLKIKKLNDRATIPTKAHDGDLGYDLYALEDKMLEPGKVTLVSTGIACAFPEGFGALLRDRSSMATKREVFVVAGVIDQGYTGEVNVALFNPGNVSLETKVPHPPVFGLSVNKTYKTLYEGGVMIKAGEKIAQMILVPVIHFPTEEVAELPVTDRGAKGFGSSGR